MTAAEKRHRKLCNKKHYGQLKEILLIAATIILGYVFCAWYLYETTDSHLAFLGINLLFLGFLYLADKKISQKSLLNRTK